MKPKWVTKDPVVGVVVHPGKSIEFMDGKYVTEDPEEIEYIKSRPEFGSRITSVDPTDIAGRDKGMVTGAVGTTVKKPGRTFRCIRCGTDGFESGFEIAKHRKSGECDEIYKATHGEEPPEVLTVPQK